jgi:hypothetical protein
VFIQKIINVANPLQQQVGNNIREVRKPARLGQLAPNPTVVSKDPPYAIITICWQFDLHTRKEVSLLSMAK